MNFGFGMATVCPPGYRANNKFRARRGQRQCLKGVPKKSLKELQAIALTNDVSIFKRRNDNMGFTRSPLTSRALKYRLTKMKVSHFGMATVCRQGYSPNPTWMRKPGQRQCLKDGTPASLRAAKPKKMTLQGLQTIARANDVSIYKRRKDNRGFTKTPLTMKVLKARLVKMGLTYK